MNMTSQDSTGRREGWTPEELSAISDVATAVVRHSDPQAVMEAGLDASLRVLRLERGWIRLINDQGASRVSAVRGVEQRQVAGLMARNETDGECGAALRGGECAIVRNAPEDPSEAFVEPGHGGSSSYLATPLMAHGA
ncbi:MAG: GAF domain-containing protein, partial [Pseudomonadota bacterium]